VAVTLLVAVAEIVTLIFLVTLFVETAKVAVLDPDATVTLAGTVATLVLVLDKVTVVPLFGAGPVRVTVPVDVPPPRSELGLKETDEAAGAVTVNDAVFVVPL